MGTTATRRPREGCGSARARLFALHLALLVMAAPICAATTARAQSPTGSETLGEARRLFLEGEQAYRLGDYEAAVRAWRQGYQVDPRPRFLYNLAQAEERLGLLQEAVDALDSYVRATSPDDPLYGEASARLGALRQRIAMTGVRIVGGPTGAEIVVDDQPWGATPRPDRIPIAPGDHQVSIRFANGGRHDVAIVVPAGQVVDVRVPEGSAVTPAPLASNTVEDPFVRTPQVGSGGQLTYGSTSDARRGHGLLFAGAATAGVGAIALVYGITRQTALSGCSDPGYVCLSEGPVRTQRTVGMVAGGVLLAAGATLIVVDLVGDHGAPTQARLGVGLASLELTVRH